MKGGPEPASVITAPVVSGTISDTEPTILLVAGDKAGDWRGWYERDIPLANRRFDEHLAERKGED